MTPIRVLVGNRPRLMRELLMATIADQSDIEIVGTIVMAAAPDATMRSRALASEGMQLRGVESPTGRA